MAEYSSLLADSVLRHQAWLAEHTAQIETELASKVKSEFIANMSHELRTPLNTVIGFAKLLGEHEQRRLTDAEVVEYADLIRDAATHLLAVINDILDISKMQSGKYTLDAREVELEEILQVALASFGPHAAEVGVALESRHRCRTCRRSRAIPAKLRQVFGNLISNAIKFTPPGGTVRVEAGALRGRRRHGARARHGPRHDRGRDRGGADAVRPGRRQPLALARGRRAGPADRQGSRAAARRARSRSAAPSRSAPRSRSRCLRAPRCRTCTAATSLLGSGEHGTL